MPGGTPLMHAALFGHAGCVESLLLHGADPEARKELGNTALIIAARHGKVDCVRLLLDHGAELDSNDDVSLTLTL